MKSFSLFIRYYIKSNYQQKYLYGILGAEEDELTIFDEGN
jgi:hypothetical protein